MASYYMKQFTDLNPIHTLKVQLLDDNQKTNILDLNKECIDDLMSFLETYKILLED